jgi:hypothetical protein
MDPRSSRRWHILAISVFVIGLFGWPTAGAVSAGAETTFSGQAKVVDGTVLGVPITLVDTGPVALSGGNLEANLLCYPSGTNCTITSPVGDPTNGALTAQVLHAAVIAGGHKSHAEASVAKFGLNAAGQSIAAEFLRADADANCNSGKASVKGTSDVVGLVINGTPINVTGAVNQTVPLPGGGLVIINEQTASANANKGDVTVSALHIKIPGPLPGANTDLVVAQAHADILCGTGQPTCTGADKVTGGGYVLNNGAKRNFAVAGRQLQAWGHFLFVDHATGDKMKATRVDPITFDAGFAVITGVAQVNGRGDYRFTLKVKDNGEPGRGSDQFQLTSGYATMNQPLTTLTGGNIQFHKPCK